MTYLVEIVIDILLYLILTILGYYSGEILLFLLSFGKRRINRYNFFSFKNSTHSEYLLKEKSTWIGVIFWMVNIPLLVHFVL